jgi:homoaconitase/3-isopropylmalate dehydratase large subunit
LCPVRRNDPSDPEQRKRGTTAIADPEIRHMVELLESNTTEHGIPQFGIADERQGIHHVAGPETTTLVCGNIAFTARRSAISGGKRCTTDRKDRGGPSTSSG